MADDDVDEVTKRIAEQPPPGMIDGEVRTQRPGEPKPQLKIITDDGEVMTEQEFEELERLRERDAKSAEDTARGARIKAALDRMRRRR